MIKVKTFVMNSGNQLHHERLDTAINKFIEENEITEVVDIKYSTSMSGDANKFYCLLSAMLIYREGKMKVEPSANEEVPPTDSEQCQESMRRILEMDVDEINEQLAQRLKCNEK